jgi:hypothetical protein
MRLEDAIISVAPDPLERLLLLVAISNRARVG